MKSKKYQFVIFLVLMFCLVGAVSATEDVSTDTQSTTHKQTVTTQTPHENTNEKISTQHIKTLTMPKETKNEEKINNTDTSESKTTTTKNTLKAQNNNEDKITKTNTETLKNGKSKTITLNSINFDEYVTDGKFNDKISNGDTIDINGKLEGARFALDIDKPLNIISSNKQAYFNFHTGDYMDYNEPSGGIFKISKTGSGTNVTGITFYNTHVMVENTSNVHIDNIKVINEHSNIGSGVGVFSVREGSEHITITNSYFKTWDNGGHSNVVFAAAYNCLFENNTVESYRRENPEGMESVGNLLYLTTYKVGYATIKTNINITIRNNIIRSMNVPSGFAMHYGLCLEGTGHIIENNYIDTNYPVMAQYADSSYGMETNIDKIQFINNTITRGLSPQLIFPGIVANNTFGTNPILKQVIATGNTFKQGVIIQNNVLFENNTANKVQVTGFNNTLNNNEVYSNEDYAVIVTGENNTLTNNKFASAFGRGEKAISSSTEIVSINNSEDISRTIYINADNFDEYFINETVIMNGEVYPQSKYFNFKENLIHDNDFIILDLTNTNKAKNMVIRKSLNNTISITLKLIAHDEMDIFVVFSGLTLINSTVPYVDVRGENLTLINSIVLTATSTAGNALVKINSTVLSEYPKDNTWILSDYQRINSNIAPKNKNGILDSSIVNDATILVYKYDSGGLAEWYCAGGLFIDRKLGFENVPSYGSIECDVSFIDGSQFSNVNNIRFDGKVYVNTTNIQFTNCTFNKGLEINNAYVTLDNNTINGTVTLNSANDLIFTNNIVNSEETFINIINSRRILIENNTITTLADNTIIFDEDSTSNTVKNNILIANSLIGDDTVIPYDNTVEDNTPSYNTSIIITPEEAIFKNDITTVQITVNNVYNNTPVTKGYVEVYFDGVFQGIKTLVNGQTSININTNQSALGSVPIKVWYYDGIKYNNNNSKIMVNVVKSNVTINTGYFIAKMNEKTNTNIIFLNQKGNPVQDTNITVTIGRTTYTIKTINGVVLLNELVTTEWLDAGKMTIVFPETNMYNKNITTINLNTAKADIIITPEIIITDNTVDIKLNYTDKLENNAKDGKVTITLLNGTTLASGKIQNGIYTTTIILPEDYTDEYIVTNYTNSFYYNDLAHNIKLSSMLNSVIKLELNNPVYGEELVINCTLLDSKNNPIKDNILLNLNGTQIIQTTDDNGKLTYSYIPGLGVNTITVTFAGNSDINPSSTSKNITIRDVNHEINDLINQLEERIRELENNNNTQTQEINNLNEQINNLINNNITELNNQIADLKEQNNNLTEENTNNTQTIHEQNDKINTLQNTVNTQTQQLQEVQKTTNDLKELQTTLTNAGKQLEQLKKQISNTTANLKTIKTTNTNLKNNLNKSNKQIAKLKKQLNIATAKLKTVKAAKAVKKSKKLVITAKLNKKVKGRIVSVIFNGKTYKAKTNAKGIAKITIKKSALQKIKPGKKIKYQVICGDKIIKKAVKIKK